MKQQINPTSVYLAIYIYTNSGLLCFGFFWSATNILMTSSPSNILVLMNLGVSRVMRIESRSYSAQFSLWQELSECEHIPKSLLGNPNSSYNMPIIQSVTIFVTQKCIKFLFHLW